MKQYIIILFLFLSCDTVSSDTNENTVNMILINKISKFGNHPIYVYKTFIDNCMYITLEEYNSVAITHAGNCPNPIHR